MMGLGQYDYDEDGPSAFFDKVRQVKSTRKEHICGDCKKVIPVGSPAKYHVHYNDYDGFSKGVTYYYTCDNLGICMEVMMNE